MNEIKHIAIKDLTVAPDNPFKVQMDTEMEQLIENIAENGRQLHQCIRLSHLIIELLQKVDEGRIALTLAVTEQDSLKPA